MRIYLAITLALIGFCVPACADQILGTPRIAGLTSSSGNVVLPGGLTLGTISGADDSSTPSALAIERSRSIGSTDGFTALGRHLAARTGDVINVADAPYSVACNGNTDVAAGIQAAIAASVLRPIYIPPQVGKCLLSTPLVAKAGLVLYAQRGTVVFAPTAGNVANPALFSASAVSELAVAGLGFDGDGQDFTNPNPLASVYRATGVTFDQTDWSNARGNAIVGSNVSDTRISASSFTNIGNHWKTTGASSDRRAAIALCCNDQQSSTSNSVHGNAFTDIGLDAISATEQIDFSADSNKCRWSFTEWTMVTAPDYPACIYVKNSDGIVVSKNFSYQAPGNAFDIVGTRFVVSGNNGTMSGAAGVAADGASGAITGNVLTNNGRWALAPQRGAISLFGAANVSVSGNTATDIQATKTQPYGIWGNPGSVQTGLSVAPNNVVAGNLRGSYGGSIAAPTTLTVPAGGTGLAGGNWMAYTPTLTASGGSGVSFLLASAAYQQVGKTLSLRATFHVNYTGSAPSNVSLTFPNGQTSVASDQTGSGANLSTNAPLSATTNGATTLILGGAGGAVVSASGQYVTASFTGEMQ